VNDFFEPPPPPPEPARVYRPPPWIAPPANYLGSAVPLRLLLARTDSVVVAVERATAYPMGVDLTLVVRRRSAGRTALEQPPMGFHHQLGGKLSDELLRFGVQFADGNKATSLGGIPRPHDKEPHGPVLTPHGGGGGGGRWDFGFWLYPLPPQGSLAFVCEWPDEGVALSRVEVDAAPIRDAAEKAEKLWDDEAPIAGASWTSYGPAPSE
jgi:hypothetical protein